MMIARKTILHVGQILKIFLIQRCRFWNLENLVADAPLIIRAVGKLFQSSSLVLWRWKLGRQPYTGTPR